MCKKWIKWLTIVFLFPCLLGAGKPSEVELAKKDLLVRIAKDKEGCEKARSKSILLGRWIGLFSKICPQIEKLDDLVKETSPDELPYVLVDIYIDELGGGPKRGQYPPMKDYLEVFGNPAVDSLMNRYEEVPDNRRQYVLLLLGEIGSEKALPLIRSQLLAKNLFTLSASAAALRMIKNESAKEELLPLLKNPGFDPKAIPLVTRQLSMLEDPGWHDVVLDLVEEGKIGFEIIAELAAYSRYPETVVVEHLDLIFSQWNSDNGHHHKAAACLLFQIQERRHLKKLWPILDDLLHAQFLHPQKRFSSPSVYCRKVSGPKQPSLFDRIESSLTLDDIEEWIDKPAPSWLSYLYLRDLYRKKGGQPFDTSKLVFRLNVSVYDDKDGTLLGESSKDFPNGVKTEMELKLKNSNARPYKIIATTDLKKDRWRIFIPLFHVAQPVGCAFPLRIPLESYTSQKLSRDANGKRKVTKWVVRHIGPPPKH